MDIETTTTRSSARLAADVRQSEKTMEPFRANRRRFVREYAGPYYGSVSGGSVDEWRQPLNLLFSMVSTLAPNLMLAPRVNITTKKQELRPFAVTFMQAADKTLEEMDAAQAFREAITDALFCAGVVKTGIGASPSQDFDEPLGYMQDPGRPFVETVDLDDYIPDFNARRREAMAYEGNRYRVPFEWAMETGLYKKDLLEQAFNAQVANLKPRTSEIAQPQKPTMDDHYVREIELVDLWLPHEGIIVTLPGDCSESSKYISEAQWEGPESGPYDVLGFMYPPGNIMPISLIGIVYDLHVLINRLARKVARQAERQKDIGVYSGKDEAGAENIKHSSDGDLVRVDNTDSVKTLSFGGANPTGYESVAWFQDFMNRISGNTDILGGLKANANTLGQDELNMQGAAQRITDMRKQVFKFASKVTKKVAWYLWTDPETGYDLSVRLPGGAEVPLRWDPETREGDFLDYNFDMQPYSVEADTPQQQYERMMTWVERVLMPLAPMAAQAGMQLDAAKIATITGQKLDIDEADSIFRPGEPTAPPGAPSPPNTARPAGLPPTMTLGGKRVPGTPVASRASAPKQRAAGQPTGAPA